MAHMYMHAINIMLLLFSGKIVPYMENTVAHGSVLTILAISMERYRVVCYPLKGISEGVRKVWRIVIVIWIISAGASLPWLYISIHKDSNYLDGTPIKVCRSYLKNDWQKAYIVILCFVFFILPCSILLCLYCRVCYVLHKARKETSNMRLGQTNSYKDKKRLKRQVINILTSIVLLFFLCHLPYRVLGIWTIFDTSGKLFSLGFETYYNILYSCRIMFYLNHAVNPIIYNFVSTKFRNAVGNMFFGRGRNGSLISSPQNKPAQENSRYAQQKLTGNLTKLTKEQGNAEKRNLSEKLLGESVVSKHKRNEFFPMYAHILEGSSKDDSSSDNKCDIQIQLVDKDVNMCINYTKTNGKRTQSANCCYRV